MAIAFFDLDKTLLAVNSASLWVKNELALGHLRKRDALRAFAWLVRYEMGFAAAENLVAAAVEHLKGSSSIDLRDRTRQFYDLQIRHLVRSGALQAVERHRRAGDKLVLLTSSSNYMSELVKADLNFDETLCNRLEVDDRNRHTGRVVGPICFGDGKLFYARAAAERASVSLIHCTFYTDSYSDLSVLEKVGFPVAVNPDPRLRRAAAKRRWSIVDWGAPQIVSQSS